MRTSVEHLVCNLYTNNSYALVAYENTHQLLPCSKFTFKQKPIPSISSRTLNKYQSSPSFIHTSSGSSCSWLFSQLQYQLKFQLSLAQILIQHQPKDFNSSQIQNLFLNLSVPLQSINGSELVVFPVFSCQSLLKN